MELIRSSTFRRDHQLRPRGQRPGGLRDGYGLDATAATVIGTLILGIRISGVTFLGVDTYFQDIVKDVIIGAAGLADQCRRRKRA